MRDRIAAAMTAFVLAAAAGVARGDASFALDTADDPAYDNGWTNGSNGGYGFGAWNLSASGGGFFIGSSANNAGGSAGIDTGGESWGLWSGSTGDVNAIRAFSNGTMSVGEAFLINLDNGWVYGGGSVGVGLQNSSGQNLWEYYFVGGGSDYTINDNAGQWDSGIPYTPDGMSLEFQLTGPTSYTLNVTAYYQGGSSFTNYNFSGSLISQADQAIARFHLWSYHAGDGSEYDFFANTAQAIPEPSVASLLLAAGAGCWVFRRRRR